MSQEPIEFQIHPPERGKGRSVVLASPGCCCTCCCLHSIGGLLGAAIASALVASKKSSTPPTPQLPAETRARERFQPANRPQGGEQFTDRPAQKGADSEQITETPAKAKPAASEPDPDVSTSPGYGPGMRGVHLYWAAVLCLTPIAWICIAGTTPGWGHLNTVGTLFFLFLCFPAVQLASTLVSALLVLWLPPAERDSNWQAIGKITLYSFLGFLLGSALCSLVLVGGR